MCKGVRVLCLTALLLLIAGPSLALDKGDIVFNNAPAKPTPQLQPPGSRLTLLSEGFENEWPPAGWTVMTSGLDYPWQQLTNYPHTGAYAAGVWYGSPGNFQDEWLVTPALNTMGLGALFLDWWEYEVYWAGYGLRHSIAVSTTVPDDPAAFTEVLLMTPSTWTINQYEAPVTLNLSDYVGYETVYVAIRYEGDWADDWYVDDVRVYEPFADDVMAVAAIPDGQTFLAGTDVYPQLRVMNVGVNTETFDVEFTVDHNGTILYTETVTVVDLVSDEERTLDFPMFTATPGYYVFTGTTLLAGDMDPDNDTAVANNDCFSGQRTPLGILYTEWGCGPCVAANQALDAWYPTQGNDASLVRVHVWWPSGTDPMYWDNQEQCDYLLGMAPQNVNGVPWLYMDNSISGYDLDWGTWPEGVLVCYSTSAAVASPLEMQVGYDQDNASYQALVNVIDPLNPNGNYRLFVAVTEDGVPLQGPNGEPIHNQVFRYLFPGTVGLPIDTSTGIGEYWVDLALDPGWVYDNLRGTAWVQDMDTGKILNSATMFLHEGAVAAFLQNFTAEPLAGSVALSFQFSANVDVSQLELLASNGSHDWTVPVTAAGVGFEARDSSPFLSQGGTVTYSLFYNGNQIRSQTVELGDTPSVTKLDGAYPNPFNPMTNIKFSVDRAQTVRIAVYDVGGRLVSVIADEPFTQGAHSVTWDGKDQSGHAVSSGTYFARMETQGFVGTEKLMLVQ